MALASILVVDDEPIILEFLSRALTTLGYDVIPADGPATALAIVKDKANCIDLVLSDLYMPVMCGRELVQEIRKLCSSTSVLYMSGYAAAEELPCDAVLLEKPFSLETLAGKVKQVLAASHAPQHV